MHEQLTGTGGINIKVVSWFVVTDVSIEQDEFALINASIAVFKVRTTFAEGFHLSTGQNNAGFVSLLDMVIKPSATVYSNTLLTARLLLSHNKALSDQLSANNSMVQ